MIAPLDVQFLGHPNVIASCLLEGGSDGIALIDPGPTTSLDGLRAALAARGRELAEVEAILLTHIHLDHAGGTGAIVRQHPRVRVYVHERGAPHVVDPAKLVVSASRLYGPDMERLWGDVLPVPSANVHVLCGGECIRAAGRELRVEYTPGHASHHVSFFEPETRTAFVGDTAGMRIGDPLYVAPPTPPPDLDLDAWEVSLARILAWRPERLFITHFGLVEPPEVQVDELRARTREWLDLTRTTLGQEGLTDEQRAASFAETVRASIVRQVGETAGARYSLAIPFELCWMGLARWLRKRAG